MSKKNKTQKKVMVFGVFDELHDGHRDFLRQAKEYGDNVVVVVARDAVIARLYGKKPNKDEITRISNLLSEGYANDIVMGHIENRKQVFAEHKPDVIVLGFSQEKLAKELKEKEGELGIEGVDIVLAEPYNPEKNPPSEFTDGKIHV